MLKEIKTPEDIFIRAKTILKKYSDQNINKLNKVDNVIDEIFLKAVFSYHPTKRLSDDASYSIIIGKYNGINTYFIPKDSQGINKEDAISIKKCVHKIIEDYSLNLKEQAEKQFKGINFKKLAVFLSKIMNLYPFI